MIRALNQYARSRRRRRRRSRAAACTLYTKSPSSLLRARVVFPVCAKRGARAYRLRLRWVKSVQVDDGLLKIRTLKHLHTPTEREKRSPLLHVCSCIVLLYIYVA